MIVYQSSKSEFLEHIEHCDIEDVILSAYTQRTGHGVGLAEIESWQHSLRYMAEVLDDEQIPADAGVAIEYHLPQMAKRVDFIVTGRGEDSSSNVIIVELKQWTKAKLTNKDGVVETRFAAGAQEVSHPSYQAWSYAALLQGFNEAVYAGDMQLKPCAYLHNYKDDGVISHAFYAPHIERAPLFLQGVAEKKKLRDFIKKFVKFGDDCNLLYRIDNGAIRPSKMLADSLVGLMQGKQEFVLIDDQKVVYETALAVARGAGTLANKEAVIVKGGPGTGKTVVAINLLVGLTKLGLNCRYVSKNAAPRAVYESKLTGHLRKSEISNLFSGSGAFTQANDAFDVLVVDEAHRLNEKSGLYGNLGVNQIKELMSAARCTIFFVDDDQLVTLKDIGSISAIERWAAVMGARVTHQELASQFRCNGSDGYLAWLDNTLAVRPTANVMLDVAEFDFRVLESPVALDALIREKNGAHNKARLVAGYCWDWISKRNPDAYDIVLPGFDFKKRWNLSKDGSLWIVAPDSVEEIGCIHTSQGLELDYVGVIIGPDFVVRDGVVATRPDNRAKSDQSLRGYKRLEKSSSDITTQRVERIIKNTYRTLLTRGMKGCYVYCVDPETAAYFRSRLIAKTPVAVRSQAKAEPSVANNDARFDNVLPFRRLSSAEAKPFVNSVPLIDLKFAAGAFGDFQSFDPAAAEWVELPDLFRPRVGLFVAQVIGESMNRRIPNGAWCLFRLDPPGTRAGKVVVAEHRSIQDPDLGGSYTVKVYFSEKAEGADGSWQHVRIHLRPDSDDAQFAALVFEPENAEGVRIVAELIAVL
ncbi:DNA/RNA helicase domain-containing protein [Variovorax robiniae]|uniref:DNA/RNA helicase domain-containing protein n=1 Tax=Variovorax robiniae TaxID=1836199 RepID=A0ABU8X8R2_9BURK